MVLVLDESDFKTILSLFSILLFILKSIRTFIVLIKELLDYSSFNLKTDQKLIFDPQMRDQSFFLSFYQFFVKEL